jgi:hypothetical protein
MEADKFRCSPGSRHRHRHHRRRNMDSPVSSARRGASHNCRCGSPRSMLHGRIRSRPCRQLKQMLVLLAGADINDVGVNRDDRKRAGSPMTGSIDRLTREPGSRYHCSRARAYFPASPQDLPETGPSRFRGPPLDPLTARAAYGVHVAPDRTYAGVRHHQDSGITRQRTADAMAPGNI